MTFSMCVATFVVSLLWTIYGQLVQDNFILVSNLRSGVLFPAAKKKGHLITGQLASGIKTR